MSSWLGFSKRYFGGVGFLERPSVERKNIHRGFSCLGVKFLLLEENQRVKLAWERKLAGEEVFASFR